jgi:hypothetical protein
MDETRSRRNFLTKTALLSSTLATAIASNGCTTPWFGEPESPMAEKAREIKDLLNSDKRPQIVGDISNVTGLNTRRFDSFGLVSKLAGTGADVKTGPQREAMLKEIRTRNITRPNELLASKETAVVKVTAYAIPGTLKGDALDAIVECSTECEATSLQNGFLLPAHLQEYATLKNSIRTSHDKATVTGPIVFLPRSMNDDHTENLLKGRILGGAKVLDTRTLGIRIREQFSHVLTTSAVAKAINERFATLQTVATNETAEAKNDGFIHLELHPKYAQDADHFMGVVRGVGFMESETTRIARMEDCSRKLLEPTTCKYAALQLEAIGHEAIDVLATGLQSQNREIQFRSAYALAFLDSERAVPKLSELAMAEPAFRPLCYVGLAALEHPMAKEALEELLQYPDPEVRYGALLALRQKDKRNPFVVGSRIGTIARLIEIPSETTGVAVSLEKTPEIVVYGQNPILRVPGEITISSRLQLQPDGPVAVRLSRAGEFGSSESVVVPSDLRSILFAIEELGGTYNDMVQLIDRAAIDGWLPYALACNPRPHTGRVFERETDNTDEFDEKSIGLAADPYASAAFDIPQEIIEEKPDYAWWDARRLFVSESE